MWPPAARYFEGTVDTNDAFIAMTDADGHFAAGVRLPHVESTVHGHTAGAPLGLHRPLFELGLPDPFKFIGGTFTCFTDDELRTRYPSHHGYVKRVKRAADQLHAKRYITNEDRKALIAAALEEPPTCQPTDDDGNDLQGSRPRRR